MPSEFEQRKEAVFPSADAGEVEALRFVKSWHRYPGIHEAIWYRGVNLGELDEFILLSPVLKTMLRRAGRIAP